MDSFLMGSAVHTVTAGLFAEKLYLNHTNIITNSCATLRLSELKTFPNHFYPELECPWAKAAKPEVQDSRQEMRSVPPTILT